MKKMTPLIVVSIGLLLFVIQTGSLASITVDRDSNNENPDTTSAISCGPNTQVAEGSTGSGNFSISTFLSDEELGAFKYESVMFELNPGQTDTISHRHDCDVFLTVLEGTLLMGQEFNKPDTVKTGEIFHEKRNVIHSLSTNPSKDQKMRALVTIIRKNGRAFYTPLYPKK